MMSGTSWEGVPGTDHQLAKALTEHVDVLWVDPPASALRRYRRRRSAGTVARGVSTLSDHMQRLHVVAPPGVTRPVVRSLAGWLMRWHLHRYAVDREILGIILTHPEAELPRLPQTKILYVTDDWPSGADLMGLSRARVEKLLDRNMAEADIIAAVTPDLADLLNQRPGYTGPPARWLPNGCTMPDDDVLLSRPADAPPGRFAILIGQLNDRIDGDLLLAVAEAGVPIVVIGPKVDRRGSTSESTDAALAHPNVRWLGYRPQNELQAYLKFASVGLTPYLINDFNKSSLPLKSLEYLAAGLPVVSTDLPFVRHLNCPSIHVGTGAGFADAVWQCLNAPPDLAGTESRREFARSHSWRSRAAEVLTWVTADSGSDGHSRELSSRSQV